MVRQGPWYSNDRSCFPSRKVPRTNLQLRFNSILQKVTHSISINCCAVSAYSQNNNSHGRRSLSHVSKTFLHLSRTKQRQQSEVILPQSLDAQTSNGPINAHVLPVALMLLQHSSRPVNRMEWRTESSTKNGGEMAQPPNTCSQHGRMISFATKMTRSTLSCSRKSRILADWS